MHMSGRDPGNPSGSNKPQVTIDDVVSEMEPGVPYGTAEIADAVGVADRTAKKWLDRFADDGAVKTKKVGRTSAWFLPCDGQE